PPLLAPAPLLPALPSEPDPASSDDEKLEPPHAAASPNPRERAKNSRPTLLGRIVGDLLGGGAHTTQRQASPNRPQRGMVTRAALSGARLAASWSFGTAIRGTQ